MSRLLIIVAIGYISLVSFSSTEDWGFFGHRQINKFAVFTLPPDLMPFYKKHIAFISEHAVDPDKRRYATKYEAQRHYIDIDHWGEYPFDNVPRDLYAAVAKYCDVKLILNEEDTITFDYQSRIDSTDELIWNSNSGKEIRCTKEEYLEWFRSDVMSHYYEDHWLFEPKETPFHLNGMKAAQVQIVDRFSAYGIVPYHLLSYLRRLTRAFEARDEDRILRLSADMGHYVGDAHVPLHTTENYNGRMTNQVGIHAFWESRIPELMALDEYDFFVGKAEYIDNPKEYFWNVVLESHLLVDSVLLIEKRVRSQFPEDAIYCFENRLDRVVRLQCEDFTRAYAEAMKGMVEKRMQKSIQSIGSVWFTAWVDAGQPQMESDVSLDSLFVEADEWNKAFQKGEYYGREHQSQ